MGNVAKEIARTVLQGGVNVKVVVSFAYSVFLKIKRAPTVIRVEPTSAQSRAHSLMNKQKNHVRTN